MIEKRSIIYFLNNYINLDNYKSFFLRKYDFVDALYIFKDEEYNNNYFNDLFISLNTPVRNINIEFKNGEFLELDKIKHNIFVIRDFNNSEIFKLHFFFGVDYLNEDIHFYLSDYDLCSKDVHSLNKDFNDICTENLLKIFLIRQIYRLI